LAQDVKRTHLLRRAVQVGFVTLIAYHVVGGRLVSEGTPGQITNPEAFCPFGGIETAYSYFSTDGRFVAHTHLSNLIVLIAVLAVTLVFKSAFCGWICPFGAIQDWLYNFRQLFSKREIHLPRRVEQVLRGVKYVVLAWLLFETARTGVMVFRDYDPYSSLLNLGKETALAGTIILALTTVLSLVVERPWCSYACPLGAAVGLVGRLSLFKIRRDEATCLTGCTLCNRACPSGLEVKKFKTLATDQCVNCMSCVAGCPTGALAVRLPRLTLPSRQSEAVTVAAGDANEKVS